MNVVVFSGTTEGRSFSRALATLGAAVTVCVATELGAEEQGCADGITVRTGRLDAEGMTALLRGAALCVDATHPYAAEATRNIRAAAAAAGVEYHRLLRPASPLPAGSVVLADAARAAAYLADRPGRVLLATGAKELPAFAALDPARLYPRVLPTLTGIAACETAGVPHRNILAMQGPFTKELNAALLHQFHIDYMVTKDGGAAAINRVPRQMITEALLREADAVGYGGGFAVVISIEGGEAAAKRTFNPHLGVEGGLSVLGTSGIVEPMSQQALLDTLQIEIHQAALKSRRLILAPGNYGLDYLAANYPALHEIPIVKISNFIGEALDMAAAEHFAEVLLVGHVGKLVKLAGGIMNTHSRCADCRTELFCAHAALCGADAATCRALMDAATTDACLDILDAAQLREPVMASLLTAIQLHLDRRAAGAFKVGAVLFSNRNGPLGQTKTADTLLKLWKGA